MTNFVGDIALLAEALRDKNILQLTNLQNKWLQQHHWTINHPTKPRTPTFARAIATSRNVHFTFFSDSANSNRWCLIQVYDLADGVWIDGETIHFNANPYSERILSTIKNRIEEISDFDNLFKRRARFAGILLSHSRPAHFFFDQCKALPALTPQNHHVLAHTEDCFFPLDRLARELNVNVEKQRADSVYIVPGLIGGTPSNDDPVLPLLRESITSRPLEGVNTDFVLWIGITREKREWVNQVEGYVYCINRLADTYENCTVLVDGFTAPHGKEVDMPAETTILNEIKAGVSDNVSFVNLIGRDYATKVSYCLDATAFITYAGTPLIVPLRICNKPGVIHSNRRYWTNEDKCWNSSIRMPELLDVQEVIPKKWTKPDFINYTIEPDIIYQLLLDALQVR